MSISVKTHWFMRWRSWSDVWRGRRMLISPCCDFTASLYEDEESADHQKSSSKEANIDLWLLRTQSFHVVNVNVNVRHTYWAPLNPVTEALHAVELTLFMWHMPEGVVEHSFLGCNHQSTCMPQLQPLCSAALVPNVLPRRDEFSGKPCAVIGAS